MIDAARQGMQGMQASTSAAHSQEPEPRQRAIQRPRGRQASREGQALYDQVFQAGEVGPRCGQRRRRLERQSLPQLQALQRAQLAQQAGERGAGARRRARACRPRREAPAEVG